MAEEVKVEGDNLYYIATTMTSNKIYKTYSYTHMYVCRYVTFKLLYICMYPFIDALYFKTQQKYMYCTSYYLLNFSCNFFKDIFM